MINLDVTFYQFLFNKNNDCTGISCICKYTVKTYIDSLTNMFKMDNILITDDYFNYILCENAKIIDVNKKHNIYIDIEFKHFKVIDNTDIIRNLKLEKICY